MKFRVLTIFPELFGPFLEVGLIGKAIDKGLLDIGIVNIRDYTEDRHRTVDDAPYGGGPGMIFKVEPVVRAMEAVESVDPGLRRIYLSPKGDVFDQKAAERLASLPGVVLLCGRYEGVDQRIVDHFIDEELSVGDYVLNGGEVAAMAVIEAVSRLIPGVVGCGDSVRDDSISRGGLKYPQYTRPAEFRGYRVPDVLLSGHQAKIEEWREEMSRVLTEKRKKSSD